MSSEMEIERIAFDYSTRIGMRHDSSADAYLCHRSDIEKALKAAITEAIKHARNGSEDWGDIEAEYSEACDELVDLRKKLKKATDKITSLENLVPVSFGAGVGAKLMKKNIDSVCDAYMKSDIPKQLKIIGDL